MLVVEIQGDGHGLGGRVRDVEKRDTIGPRVVEEQKLIATRRRRRDRELGRCRPGGSEDDHGGEKTDDGSCESSPETGQSATPTRVTGRPGAREPREPRLLGAPPHGILSRAGRAGIR